MLDLTAWFRLNRREVERQFALSAVDLKEIVTLDGIDVLPDESWLRIRSHDLYGPLPEIIFPVDPADRHTTFACLQREPVKLCTVARYRRELEDIFRGASFLPPTKRDTQCVVGIRWQTRAVLAEAPDFMDAYHTLWREAVERFM